jgi:hypothetical protein
VSLDAMFGDTRVRGAGDEVRRALAEARARAIDSGVPHRFCVHTDNVHYRVGPDSDEFWGGNANGLAPGEIDDGRVLAGVLPKSIHFEKTNAADDGNGWHTIAVLAPDGTSKKDARLVVQPDDGSSPLIITVRQLTGIVAVKTKRQEEGH